ncbi:MAG: PH domain-containing protein [Deltaproteobacteria bacterium]|nr:PH domain-containing protein [Deltaproteobacteria bacterium]
MSYITKTCAGDEVEIKRFGFTKWEYINPIKLILFPLTWFRRWMFEIGVTDRRFVVKHGFIARRTGEIRLEAVEGITVKQSILGRIFGYGSLSLTGRGNAAVEVPMLANVLSVKRIVEDAKYNKRIA